MAAGVAAARPAARPPPPPPRLPRQAAAASVQVTREKIVAPPERFISLSDEVLLEHFQGERQH